jgi:hypothetical protein
MSATVSTNGELAAAIKRNESKIIIEGDLANNIYRIKLIGPIAWGIAFLAIGGAVYVYLATPAVTAVSAPVGGAGGILSFGAASASAAVAVTTIGLNATIAAIGVGVAAGSVGAITKLREKYKVSEKSDNRLVLTRKT